MPSTKEWQDGCRALEEKEFTEFSTIPECEAPQAVIGMEADTPDSVGWRFSVNQIHKFCDTEYMDVQDARSFFEALTKAGDGFHFLSMPGEFYCDYFKVWIHGGTSRIQLCCVSNSGSYMYDQHMTVSSDELREQAAKVLAVLLSTNENCDD